MPPKIVRTYRAPKKTQPKANRTQGTTSRKRQVSEDSDESSSDRGAGARQSKKRQKGKGKGKKPALVPESAEEKSNDESDEPQVIELSSDPENDAEREDDEVHSYYSRLHLPVNVRTGG